MKKFLAIAALAMLGAIGVSLTSCEKLNDGISYADSIKINKMIDETMSPSFDNADEFTRYALNEGDYQEFVQTVRTLESITIASIASNVVKEYKFVDYNGFMREYKKNRPMYDTFDKETKRAGVGEHHDEPIEQLVSMRLQPAPDTIKK